MPSWFLSGDCAQLSSRRAAFDTSLWSTRNPLMRFRSDPIRLASAPIVFTRDFSSPGALPGSRATGMPQQTRELRVGCSPMMSWTLGWLQLLRSPPSGSAPPRSREAAKQLAKASRASIGALLVLTPFRFRSLVCLRAVTSVA